MRILLRGKKFDFFIVWMETWEVKMHLCQSIYVLAFARIDSYHCKNERRKCGSNHQYHNHNILLRIFPKCKFQHKFLSAFSHIGKAFLHIFRCVHHVFVYFLSNSKLQLSTELVKLKLNKVVTCFCRLYALLVSWKLCTIFFLYRL